MAISRKPKPDLTDAARREEIRRDLDATMLVEAGAGSGKTTMLVERMIALLAAGKVVTESLAAVTFTRKAASHLRRRFQTALEAAGRSEKDAERRALIDAARSALDRLTLGTIDSFCALLLSERPLEAGIDPAALRVELHDAALFRARSFREFVGRHAEAGGPLSALLAAGVTMKELEETFELLSEYRDVRSEVAHALPLPDFAPTRRIVDDFLDRALPLVPETPLPNGRDGVQKMLLQAAGIRSLPEYGTPAGFARLLGALRPAPSGAQYKWGDKATGKAVLDEFKDLRRDVIKPALLSWQTALHERIMAVLLPALADLDQRLSREGHFTYADLLLATRDLLRDFPAVRRAFATRFTHLLVDEFQDTDPLQAEILLYLTSDDFEEKDVVRLKPRAGSLFVVGDPKQSIYRFRRADISAYMAFRRTLIASGGRIVPLNANFRAVPELTRAANEVFRKIFPDEADDRQAAYGSLDPVRTDSGPAAGAFRLRTTWEGSAGEGLARANAPDVARFVKWAVENEWPVPSEGPGRTARFADFLVLTRTREYLEIYARAFEALGVPVDVSGSRALPISKGLSELRPLLTAVQDADDAVSVAAFLSGSLCGVDDAALYQFRKLGGRFSYLVEPPPGADERITRALRLLADSRRDVRELAPGAALGVICKRLGVIARLAAGPEGRTASGNLLKVLALARHSSGQGLSFRDVVERIAEDAPALDLEEMSIEPVDASAVRLMNLHRAKGLESPIVVLAEPSDRKSFDPRRHVVRDATGSHGWFTAGFWNRPTDRPPSWLVTATPPDWEDRKKDEIAFEKAEKIRHLYVAATRARDTLVVSLRDDKPDDAAWAPLAGVLRELPPAAAEAPPPAISAAPALAEALPEARRQILEGRRRAAAPSFSVIQVTRIAKREGPRAPAAPEEARGPAWGRVLHGLLEAAMRDEGADTRLLAANLLREEELPPELLPEVLRVAASVTSSDLWARAKRASRRFVEVPFEILVPREELGLTEGPADVLLKGAMDLVFEEARTWLIVDWKSDTVGENLPALIAHYAPQVAIYRRYWEQLTKQPAKAGLYFLDNGHLEWIAEEPGERKPPGISSKGHAEKPVWKQEELFDE